MAGFKRRIFNTVVMDGSNNLTVDNIVGVIEMVTDKRHGRVYRRPMDETHPSMIIIETTTNSFDYNLMQDMIEKQYPGLCTFDVKL